MRVCAMQSRAHPVAVLPAASEPPVSGGVAAATTIAVTTTATPWSVKDRGAEARR
jgi:hypothetical protein